jgi:hypothetical protein
VLVEASFATGELFEVSLRRFPSRRLAVRDRGAEIAEGIERESDSRARRRWDDLWHGGDGGGDGGGGDGGGGGGGGNGG